MFDRDLITRKFEHIGARIHIGELQPPRWGPDRDRIFTLDIERDRRGELFGLRIRRGAEQGLELLVLDTRPKDRHLLIMTHLDSDRSREKDKFLCGHDERFWFVAAVPESAGASNVREAKEALKPDIALQAQTQAHVKTRHRNRRRNDGFVRQGEWFFIPEPGLVVPKNAIHRNEPLSRGAGSKPHMVAELYREGGQTVYVCRQYPNGLTDDQRHELLKLHPEKAKLLWQIMTLNPTAHARGRVTHKDHNTVVLPFWHQIAMNTEDQSRAGAKVVFMD